MKSYYTIVNNEVYVSDLTYILERDLGVSSEDIFELPENYDLNRTYIISGNQLIPNPRYEDVLKKEAWEQEIYLLKGSLSKTDFVITKIQEAIILGADVEALKTKYSAELSQRREDRARINELETAIKALNL